MRQSRTRPDIRDRDIKFQDRDREILKLFRRYRHLTTNLIHTFVGGGYVGVQNRLTFLTACKYDKHGALHETGYLRRFTFNGSAIAARINVNGVFVYQLEDKGDKKLVEISTPRNDEYDKSHPAHQSMLDYAHALIELQSRGHLTYVPWEYIKAKSTFTTSPFKFTIGDKHLIPDGRPFGLKTTSGSIVFLTELDRCTEDETTIRNKIKNYYKIYDQIRARFGNPPIMLLFIATSEHRARKFIEWVNDEVGACKWMLAAYLPDFTIQGNKPPILPLIEWQRSGHKPFSLLTLAEVT